MKAVIDDFRKLSNGAEDTFYDWSKSSFSEENPPRFLEVVPVTLHFSGGTKVSEFLQRSAKLGQALNEYSSAANGGNYADNIYYIDAMR